MSKEIKIEICTASVESVIAAENGGADRVELCSDLFEGGLTPGIGTFFLAKEKTSIPINVMIRPRGGDFCYSGNYPRLRKMLHKRIQTGCGKTS